MIFDVKSVMLLLVLALLLCRQREIALYRTNINNMGRSCSLRTIWRGRGMGNTHGQELVTDTIKSDSVGSLFSGCCYCRCFGSL